MRPPLASPLRTLPPRLPSGLAPTLGTRLACHRFLLPRRSLSTTPCPHYQPRRPSSTAQQGSGLRNPLDSVTRHRTQAELYAHSKRRMKVSAIGLVFCAGATFATVAFYDLPPTKTEAPPTGPPFPAAAATGGSTALAVDDKVATGTSSVPYFPKTITLPPGREGSKSAALPAGVGDGGEEYHLLGLGVRTVSFLRVQVYVVGLYVAASDMAALQASFVRQAADVEAASALVPSEKERLRGMLLDAKDSEIVWDKLLREAGVRSVVRVVPTRNTDWAHLRDGWVRAVEGRAKRKRGDVEARFKEKGAEVGRMLLADLDEDDAFGEAVGRFKAIFSAGGRKAVAKGKAILLERDAKGVLRAWVEGKNDKAKGEEGEAFERMGELQDERVSRLIWMGYLAGDNVASPAARRSVVDGIIAAVSRPVGTFETQVV